MTFGSGDEVTITYFRRTIDGVVKQASPDGKSLLLSFEGILGGFAGLMPVSMTEPCTYVDMIWGEPVEIDLAFMG